MAVHQNWWRSVALTLLEKGSGMVFALGTAVVLLRGLDKATFGTWALFILITYFLEMARSGLIQNGLVRYLALHREDEPVYRDISTASIALNLSFSAFSNAVLWGLTGWLARAYEAPGLYELIPVYYATNVVMAFFYHFNFVQQANWEFRGIFWSTFFQRGALFVWSGACVVFGWALSLPQLAWAVFAGAFIGAVASWGYARPFLRHGWPVRREWVLRLTGFGKYVLGTNLSTMFYKNIDKLAIGSVLGPEAYAVYDAAGRISQLVEAPSFSIAAVVFPRGAQRMQEEGPAGIKRLYERSVAVVLAIILPFVVMVWLFAEPVVWMVAGDGYAESANLVRLTALFGVFLPFAVQFGTILDATGRPATNLGYTFFTAVLNFALSYWWVHVWGITGAALASLCGYCISFILMQRLLYRDFRIQAWRAFLLVPEIYAMGWEKVAGRMWSTTASRKKSNHLNH